jgi:DNA-directed RNA polymerase subunit L
MVTTQSAFITENNRKVSIKVPTSLDPQRALVSKLNHIFKFTDELTILVGFRFDT